MENKELNSSEDNPVEADPNIQKDNTVDQMAEEMQSPCESTDQKVPVEQQSINENTEARKDETSSATTQQEETEKDPWTCVLGHDKLKIKCLREGEADTRPSHGQLATIRCCGELEDGTKVDEFEALQFTVGDGDVIQALDLCVAFIDVNGLSQIVTDSKYAYGSIGRKPDVPANAVITYEVELLKVENVPDVTKLPIAERVKLGDEKRERGNFCYSRGEYAAAINSYTKAIRLLDETNVASESAQAIEEFAATRVKCFNNLAASQLKVEAWDAGIKSSNAVLTIQPSNCKAHFRKGKCLAAKGELEPAIASLREAIKLEPDSKLIHQELSRLVKKHKSQSQSAREMYQRMLGTDKASPQTATSKKSQSQSARGMYQRMLGTDKGSPETATSKMNWGVGWLYGGTVTAAAVVLAGIAYRYLQ